MTTAKADAWKCESGIPHEWIYRLQLGYRCMKCDFRITKAALKEATDNA